MTELQAKSIRAVKCWHKKTGVEIISIIVIDYSVKTVFLPDIFLFL